MACLAAEVDAIAAIRARPTEAGISLREALARLWGRLARLTCLRLHKAACASLFAGATSGPTEAFASVAEVAVACHGARARGRVHVARAMACLAAEVDAIAAVRARAAEAGISLRKTLARLWGCLARLACLRLHEVACAGLFASATTSAAKALASAAEVAVACHQALARGWVDVTRAMACPTAVVRAVATVGALAAEAGIPRGETLA